MHRLISEVDWYVHIKLVYSNILWDNKTILFMKFRKASYTLISIKLLEILWITCVVIQLKPVLSIFSGSLTSAVVIYSYWILINDISGRVTWILFFWILKPYFVWLRTMFIQIMNNCVPYLQTSICNTKNFIRQFISNCH